MRACWTFHVESFRYCKLTIDKRVVGLYGADGFAAINNANVPKLDRIRDDITALFKKERLSLTNNTLIKTDLLDVTFRLFKRLKIRHSTSAPFLTTNQQSANSCLR